jgi:carboxymethylenebutenolidase
VTPRLVLAALVLLSAAPAGAQEWARAALDASPRHQEWVDIPSDGRSVRAFVVYPERKDAAPAVIVIHENRGLTDWVRSFADRLAGEGYVAIAPDLLSGFDAKHRATADFADDDAARDAIYGLDPGRITADLLAVRKFAAALPAQNGKTAVIGFCWGGGEAFRFATNAAGLSAVLVFYGLVPKDNAGLGSITAPVYGFYGGNDWRINATLPETRAGMERAARRFDAVVYEDAGHAFMRTGEDPDGRAEDKAARARAWERVRAVLAAMG